MLMFALFLIIFFIILFFPFLLALFIRFDDGKETSLIVKNDNVKDPRYFSKSFKAKMKASLLNEEGEYIKLSREERVLNWNSHKSHVKQLDRLIYMDKETLIDDRNVFAKEIYATGDVTFGEKNKIRALAGENNVFLGKKNIISRWIDAENLLVVRRMCKLGISATSGDRLIIEPDCVFERLYAPLIEIGTYSKTGDQIKEEVIVNRNAPVYKKIVRDIKEVLSGQELRKTVITKNKFIVGAGAIVYGDIKSEDTVHIKKGAIVTGNVFAFDAVILEENAKVLGNVYGTEDVYIGPYATVGIIGRIKSAVSKANMVIADGAVIYGYVGTEKYGRTVDSDNFAGEVKKYEGVKIEYSNVKPAKDFERIHCNITKEGYVYLDNIDDYNDIDYYGFRDNDKIKGIIIPEGAECVNPSMFFGCDNLEYVSIPRTVKEIGEYAFYACKKLKTVVFETGTKLDLIGEYAFSECQTLERIDLPYVKKICNAAFRNDTNLETVTVFDSADTIDCAELAFHKCDKLQFNDIKPYIKEVG